MLYLYREKNTVHVLAGLVYMECEDSMFIDICQCYCWFNLLYHTWN